MDLQEFTFQAQNLINQHGLHHLGFALDRGKNRLGACHERRTVVNGRRVCTPVKLTFSRHYVSLLDWDELHDVVLHEIAHALTPGHNHDATFMRKCREIGTKPARCAKPSASPEKGVIAYCPTCGEQRGAQHRLPKVIYVCSPCKRKHGKDLSKYLLTWYRGGKPVAICHMPQRYQDSIRKHMLRAEVTKSWDPRSLGIIGGK